MIKYEIYKAHTEIRAREAENITSKEIYDKCHNRKLLYSCDTLAEARDKFESSGYMKNSDKSYYEGNVFPYYLCTIYSIEENEYDDEGEFICYNNCWTLSQFENEG